MQVLFDHGTPVPLRHALTNHTVSTAYDMGWADLDNGALLKAAETRLRRAHYNRPESALPTEPLRATSRYPGAAYDELAENSSSGGANFCRGQRAPSRRFRTADLLEPKPTFLLTRASTRSCWKISNVRTEDSEDVSRALAGGVKALLEVGAHRILLCG